MLMSDNLGIESNNTVMVESIKLEQSWQSQDREEERSMHQIGVLNLETKRGNRYGNWGYGSSRSAERLRHGFSYNTHYDRYAPIIQTFCKYRCLATNIVHTIHTSKGKYGATQDKINEEESHLSHTIYPE
ncbi:hypothetical protein GBA52_020303 [Prunus armeniaca]|nr:hypothetical protein GBA52_020303 [Prunus armeniaca]